MNSQFLDHETLGQAVVDLMKGNDVCCAVAFWGDGAVTNLFPSKDLVNNVRIVCDLSMGATNPIELEAMGAPSNPSLRHLARLHAKVYISDLGAIVCSANASDNGVGFSSVAGLIEAGSFIESGTPAFKQICSWFEQLWSRSKAVNQKALNLATEAWKRRPQGQGVGKALSIPPNAPSLLASVALDPKRFRGFGFVFTSRNADEEDRDEAATALLQEDDDRPERVLSKDDRRKIKSWPVDNLFSGWGRQDHDAWPASFVCIHKNSRENISYHFYERAHQAWLGDDGGVTLAKANGGLRKEKGFKHGLRPMLDNDRPHLARLFSNYDKDGGFLFENGESLLEHLSMITDDE